MRATRRVAHRIGLKATTPTITFAELAPVSAAIQRQLTEHVAPAWKVQATIQAFPHDVPIPKGYFQVLVCKDIALDHFGYHEDKTGTPFAHVKVSPHWTLTLSHECVEMVCNPRLERFFRGPSPDSSQGMVDVMAEVCDPCQGARYAYQIDTVWVSDFCLPAYFKSASSPHGPFSHQEHVTAPFQVLPGGVLTWKKPGSGAFFQWVDRGGGWHAEAVDLGALGAESRTSIYRYPGDVEAARSPDETTADAWQKTSQQAYEEARALEDLLLEKLRVLMADPSAARA